MILENWWPEYLSLLRDPAHILFELTLMAIFDVGVGIVAWPLVKRAVARHDAKKHSKECDHEEPPWGRNYRDSGNNQFDKEFG